MLLLVLIAVGCEEDGYDCSEYPDYPTYGADCGESPDICEAPFSCIVNEYVSADSMICSQQCETNDDCPSLCFSHCAVMESECGDGVCQPPDCD